jgi:hypothetical protein
MDRTRGFLLRPDHSRLPGRRHAGNKTGDSLHISTIAEMLATSIFFFHNCADFSPVVLDIFLPHAIHRNFLTDFGLMTQKQVARSLVNYGQKHPAIDITAFVIPQVPGSRSRSHAVDGVAESPIKSKKVSPSLVVFAPEVISGEANTAALDGIARFRQSARPSGTRFLMLSDEPLVMSAYRYRVERRRPDPTVWIATQTLSCGSGNRDDADVVLLTKVLGYGGDCRGTRRIADQVEHALEAK